EGDVGGVVHVDGDEVVAAFDDFLAVGELLLEVAHLDEEAALAALLHGLVEDVLRRREHPGAVLELVELFGALDPDDGLLALGDAALLFGGDEEAAGGGLIDDGERRVAVTDVTSVEPPLSLLHDVSRGVEGSNPGTACRADCAGETARNQPST